MVEALTSVLDVGHVLGWCAALQGRSARVNRGHSWTLFVTHVDSKSLANTDLSFKAFAPPTGFEPVLPP